MKLSTQKLAHVFWCSFFTKNLSGGDGMEGFDYANLTVAEAAKALKLDQQTIRVMIQHGLVSWGRCFKMPNSSHYMYLISPKAFYEETGYKK